MTALAMVAGALAPATTSPHRASREERLAIATLAMDQLVWDLDLSARRVHLDGATHLVRRSDAILMDEWHGMKHPDDRARVAASLRRSLDARDVTWQEQYRLRTAAGGYAVVSDRARIVRDDAGRATRVIGAIQDVSARVRFEQELERLATHDPVTGLPNRTLLRDRLERAIALAARERGTFALLYMDLDRFKEVNDSLGHHAGDELLRMIAARIGGSLRASDTVARIGGDEFAFVITGADARAAARVVSEQLLASLAEPFTLEEQRVHVDASIGLVVFPDDGADAETLLRHADVAMYSAKRNGSCWRAYRAEEDPYSRERLRLAADLRAAIEHRSLSLHYQPKIKLGTGHVLGVEALARWKHPERGMVPPLEFVSLAEESGLMGPLTMFVVREALRQCREWLGAGLEIPVAVNLSMQNLRDPDLPRAIEELVADAAIRPGLLRIEVTESNVMSEQATTIATLDELRRREIGISIDDFGTGYSSLAYLSRLPADELKIDRSFVRMMTTRESDAEIVRVTVELGRALGMRTVAEGVEDEGASDRLRAMGCDVAQGYFVSPPLAPAELVRWVTTASWHLPSTDGACCAAA